MDNILLDRRKFMGLAATGAAGSIPIVRTLDDFVNASSIAQKPVSNKAITFEGALGDSSIRPEYIQQLVQKIGLSPFVDEVIYDPKFLKLRESLGNNLVIYNNKRFEDLVPGASMMTHSLQDDFGKSKSKSTVYVSEKIFLLYNVNSSTGKLRVPPSEASIIASLIHEYTHAEQNFKGVILSNGLRIDASNYPTFDPFVEEFVSESICYIKEIETAKMLNSREAYMVAVSLFQGHLLELIKNIDENATKNLDFLYYGYLRNQANEIKTKVPELLGDRKINAFLSKLSR